MRLLIDANIFLEVILERAHVAEARQFLALTEGYNIPVDATQYGKAALLDSTNNKIWILNYNISSKKVQFDTTKAVDLGEGSNPQAMVLSEDKKKLYVANEDTATISILTLYEEDGTAKAIPTLDSTINLADYLPGKSITLKPTTLIYSNGYLLVGCDGIKGLMTIKVN